MFLKLILLCITALSFAIYGYDSDKTIVKDNHQWSDSWLLKLNGDLNEVTSEFILKHNFKIVNRIGGLPGYFNLKLITFNYTSLSSTRMRRSDENFLKVSENLIRLHPFVFSFEREKILVRKRRKDVVFDNSQNRTNAIVKAKHFYGKLTDSKWSKMWFLNRQSVFNSKLPDLNVVAAWESGFTGRGIKVCFLDDGLEWNHTDIYQNYVN
jgi:hypothetical protein